MGQFETLNILEEANEPLMVTQITERYTQRYGPVLKGTVQKDVRKLLRFGFIRRAKEMCIKVKNPRRSILRGMTNSYLSKVCAYEVVKNEK